MKRMLDHGRHSRDRREFSQEKRYSGSGFFAGLNTNIHKERSESRELNPKKFLSELAVLLVKPKVVDKQETKVPQHRYSLVS